MKHEHRSHNPGSLTSLSSDMMPDHTSYQRQESTAVSAPNGNNQYMHSQQPYYTNSATGTPCLYSSQSVKVNLMPVREGAFPIITQSLPITLGRNSHAPHNAPLSPQHQQQRYIQAMEQRHNPNACTNDPLLEYDQPPFAGYQLLDYQQTMVSRPRQDLRVNYEVPESPFLADFWIPENPQIAQTQESVLMEHGELDYSGQSMQTAKTVNCYNVIPQLTGHPREQTTLSPTTY